MARNRSFVQLSHPGREHGPDRGTEKTWNTLKHSHARKFMQLHGQWIAEDRGKQAGDLYAWGEWEPGSWSSPHSILRRATSSVHGGCGARSSIFRLEYLNPSAFRTPRGLGRDRTPDELRAAWDLLVAQVRDEGLVLGTFAELPEQR